ncbi:hypothetical protein [Salinarchaeum laminariae]|uniref:hypothetical protein n=1 Tax=Salinarchaeum laminariae TaxID=869888 RepID=UPI0020BF02E6|nr:hypothetical protein [Salinarchaeum laminariae]
MATADAGHVPDDAELDVPEGTEIYRCPYCEYPLQTERLWILHLGIEHNSKMDEAQRARYEDEHDEETHDLFTLHVKLTVVIILLYFGLTYSYMFVWS